MNTIPIMLAAALVTGCASPAARPCWIEPSEHMGQAIGLDSFVRFVDSSVFAPNAVLQSVRESEDGCTAALWTGTFPGSAVVTKLDLVRTPDGLKYRSVTKGFGRTTGLIAPQNEVELDFSKLSADITQNEVEEFLNDHLYLADHTFEIVKTSWYAAVVGSGHFSGEERPFEAWLVKYGQQVYFLALYQEPLGDSNNTSESCR